MIRGTKKTTTKRRFISAKANKAHFY